MADKRHKDLLLDRISYRGVDLVNGRCEVLIEEMDAHGGHQFAPATISPRPGDRKLPQYSWFVCGRSFHLIKPESFEPIPHEHSAIGASANSMVLSEDRALYLASLPIWTGASHLAMA